MEDAGEALCCAAESGGLPAVQSYSHFKSSLDWVSH